MPNGTVKVLDFGLAKAIGAKTSDVNVSAMPTVVGGSVVGFVLGTPGYMSPEQARGKDVDARTDIWAFGCVLYEMLTARQAFEGETVTDVMANIITSQPDLNLLPKDTPPSIRLLLASTLNKNPSQRLQHIGDARLFYEGAFAPAPSNSAAQPRGRGIRGTLVMAALLVALAAAAVPAVLYFRAAPPAAPQMRFELSLPGMIGTPALSPDGRAIAYVAQSPEGRRTIWVRPIGADTAQQLAGTEDVNGWLWSPDRRRLEFIADGKIKKIYEKASTGAGTETVMPAGDVSAIPVHWSPDNKYIVFSRLKGKTPGYDFWLLPLSGEPKPMPLLESPFDKFQARVSPDGRFVAYSTNESGMYQIVVQTFPDANGGKWQISAEGGVEPKWRRDGRELYYLALDGKLMAVSIGGPVFVPGRPVTLFQTSLSVNRTQPLRDRRYDIGPDGRFLMVVPAVSGAPAPTTVVVNWSSALEK